MPEFLPLERRGHVRAFIRLIPSQKIATGGRALSGTQKTGTVSKNSNTKPTDCCLCLAAQPCREWRPREGSERTAFGKLPNRPCSQGPNM